MAVYSFGDVLWNLFPILFISNW